MNLVLLFIASAFAIALGVLSWAYFSLRSRWVEKTHEIEELRKRGSEFVANVSHELKTPLTSIKGYTETLKSVAVHDPKKALDFLDRIEQNAERLSLLINDLLDLSRVESPNVHLEKENFDLGGLLEEIRAEFNFKLSSRKQLLIIRNEIQDLYADRRLVDQALSNLIENSHRYCPEGALIEIEAAPAHDSGKEGVRISVSDNGPGISQGDLPRIFERFYRAEKSRNRQMGGTGLGLAIVKHITLSHGGNVKVESNLGKGVRFDLFFPKA